MQQRTASITTPRGIGRIPDFELQFKIERNAAEGFAFHPDVAPLPVFQPRHMIAGADVNVRLAQVVIELGGNGVGLADLFGFQPRSFKHVVEVGIPAKVQLVGVGQLYASFAEEPGENPVRDGCPDLRFDIVSNDGQAAFFEALGPVPRARDKHGHTVDETASGLKNLLDVPLRGLFAAYRQIVDNHVGSGGFEDFCHVHGAPVGLIDDFA